MKDLVTFVAKALVDQPDSVQVDEYEKDDAVVLALQVARDDLGKVIGKQGRTAKAIRNLLAVTTSKHPKKYKLEILE